MPKTIQRLLSDVQSDIGDLSREYVQSAELVDLFNDAVHVVATALEQWHGRIPLRNNGPASAFVFWIPFSDLTGTYPAPFTNNQFSPIRVHKLFRQSTNGWIEMREYSRQAIENAQAGADSFAINEYDLGPIAYSAYIDPLNGLVINFGTPLDAGESVWLDYISSQPLSATVYSNVQPNGSPALISAVYSTIQNEQGLAALPPATIPDNAFEPLKWQLEWRVIQRLYMQGDDTKLGRMQYLEQLAATTLRKAIFETKMPKDNNSSLQIQPINWMPE